MLAERVLRAATILHASILKSGLRAPMSFFDSTPIGRIINRFSKDIDVVDRQLPRTLHSWIVCSLSILGTVIVISYSTPMFLVVVLPMSVFYYLVQVHHPIPSLLLRCPHHFSTLLVMSYSCFHLLASVFLQAVWRASLLCKPFTYLFSLFLTFYLFSYFLTCLLPEE